MNKLVLEKIKAGQHQIPHIVLVRSETKVCTDPGHNHKDPHIDRLCFTLGGHDVWIETERWSFLYQVHVDDDLRLQDADSGEVWRYIAGLTQ